VGGVKVGRRGEGRGGKGNRGEGKGKVVPLNVRDALTPLLLTLFFSRAI